MPAPSLRLSLVEIATGALAVALIRATTATPNVRSGLSLSELSCRGALPPAHGSLSAPCHCREEVQRNFVYDPELGLQLWKACGQRLAGQQEPLSSAAELLLLLEAFQQFLQPQRLVLSGPVALARLPSVSANLRHLELSSQGLVSLGPLSGCAALRCLSLRRCCNLPDAALAALAPLGLEALDLSGLQQLGDGGAAHLAKLHRLKSLNLSGTAVTDQCLSGLAYGHRLRAWAEAARQPAPQELLEAFPALPLQHLRLAGVCGLTPTGIHALLDLQQLQLIDLRDTGITRPQQQPLCARFSLSVVQPGVLASPAAVAAVPAAVLHDTVSCSCTAPAGEGT